MVGKRVATRLENESGFTILESVIALGIVFVLVVALLRTMDMSTRVIVETKRQAAATAFASELLERARSLEWNHMGLTALANGAACPDQVGCPAFSAPPPAGVFGGDLAINGSGNWAFGGEEIVFVNGAAFDPFLSFHDQQTRDDTPFDRYLFVTSVRTDQLDPGTEQYRRISALVTWSSPISGLTNDVRLSTLVSPFTEPSQPLIHGEVTLAGGTVSISGDVSGTESRGSFDANLVFAHGFTSATSDYVSSEIARSASTSGEIRYTGPDAALDTADDVVVAPVPVDESRAADDDSVSVAPLDDSNAIVKKLLPAFQLSGPNPDDFTVEDLDSSLTPEPPEYWAELWTEHNPTAADPKVDGLPYSDFGLRSADRTQASFTEYADPGIHALYLVSGNPLSKGSYEFEFFKRGHGSMGPALDYAANVDRVDTLSDDRQVHIGYDWAAEPMHLFVDEVGQEADNQFQGWVILEMPTVSSADLVAGQSAPFPPIVSTSQFDIKVWNPNPPGKYDTVFSNFGGVGNCSAAPAATEITIDDGAGGPVIWDIAPAGDPNLHYEVMGSIWVREPCYTYAQDANGDVSEARVQATGMVTGTIRYSVVDTVIDTVADGTLYDVEISFDAGGVGVTALYIDPEAS